MSGRKGFSLLEVLLTIVLFSTGFVIVLQIISAGLFAGGQNEYEITALYLAQEKVEELRNAPFASIIPEAKAVVNGFPAFSREVAVSTPQNNLNQITATVYWYAKNTETNYVMVTYVSNT